MPPDWLNNEACGLASDKFGYSDKMIFSNLTVYIGSDEYILACKLRAGRSKDYDDAIYLMDMMKVRSSELRDIYLKYYKVDYKWDEVKEFIKVISEEQTKTE